MPKAQDARRRSTVIGGLAVQRSGEPRQTRGSAWVAPRARDRGRPGRGVRNDGREAVHSGDRPRQTAKNDQLFSMFNGRLDNGPVAVNRGDLVRMYFVNIGPWTSAAHVIGTVLDRVYAGAPWISGVQTFAVPAGSGAVFEFYIPEDGVFPFVDHDKLAFLPFGMALAFATDGVPGASH